ncbi:hypothetical protein [Cupriavidus sp. AU9028]|uniref:hypothetical protein n=1 Tax=Cupriavidus sp. AU9028 TaxID=2871157 RepID=UPI001C9775DD|nr:hypothetical protein [Cupriavidus sp. AU9028]MBY4898559.1 hypothetical protein [Cupriavidus sp. AU9028]
MKEMFYRDHVIAAHAVPVGASTGVRYGYQGEILPAEERSQGLVSTVPRAFASDIELAYDNAATAVEACLLEGRRLIDAALDGAETPTASAGVPRTEIDPPTNRSSV